ncbi:kynurenine formamidase [Vreelandella songnenensis]|uniref:Kynurenine formamidase n=1 Tax=Vreelandella songnenensis TaxID=1176243 RepID=A0A2T0V409_9GAMM|nr:cyclase family protein [Halomonas songnenensis]PRY64857.1 kynurenine formamidase [Halomonas songnenensis]
MANASQDPRWQQRPEGANWGDFGPDDQLGRVNLLGPEQVLKGAREVVTGNVFSLSLPLDLPGGNALNPRRFPPRLAPTSLGQNDYLNFPLANLHPGLVDVISDDQVVLSLQYSSQWDSLAHVGALFDADGDGHAERCYYNGYRAETDIQRLDGEEALGHSRAQRLGVENMAVHGMQGRGVLVDLVRVYGHGRTLVGYKELMRALDELNVTIEPGDMLVLRTGFADAILEMAGQPDVEKLKRTGAVLDGTDASLLQWISDSGIVAICADNYAVENADKAIAPEDCCKLPLHHHCLFKLGLPLAELWYLTPLADWLHEHQRSRFLLTAPPLRLPGAIGSPVTPIATV